MKTLEQLQADARKIGDQISRIESAQIRKKNAPLVGKTFKSQNNYSCPEKPSDYWWEYAKVVRMDKWGALYAVTFAIDSYGNARTHHNNCIHHAQNWTRIPVGVFDRARTKFMARVGAELRR